jgi:hypothetical protein
LLQQNFEFDKAHPQLVPPKDPKAMNKKKKRSPLLHKKMKPREWMMVDSGWYLAIRDGKDVGIGISKEHDGWWHLYYGKWDEPRHSHSRYRTLKEAKTKAARVTDMAAQKRSSTK